MQESVHTQKVKLIYNFKIKYERTESCIVFIIREKIQGSVQTKKEKSECAESCIVFLPPGRRPGSGSVGTHVHYVGANKFQYYM